MSQYRLDQPPPLFACAEAPAKHQREAARKPDPMRTPYRRESEPSTAGARLGEMQCESQLTRYIVALHRAGPVSRDGSTGGLTDAEAAKLLNLQHSVICARRGSARGKDWAIDSGKRRDGGRGVRVTVWCHRSHMPTLGGMK